MTQCNVVCGETPKQERETLIELFRQGDIRCLVTVLALSTGFDVPDVDCLIWCRPTRSPVLYVQGFGRACRIAPGKTDALVLDFTDTTERMGPVDLVKGRAKKRKDGEAPFVVCDNCGTRNHAKAMVCSECGAQIAHAEKEAVAAKASLAPILSTQIQPAPIVWHDVSRVDYSVHRKEGKPDSLRVDYWSGMMVVGSEWICFEHSGYARQKAEQWWAKRGICNFTPDSAEEADRHICNDPDLIREPTRIATRKNGKYTEVVNYEFQRTESHERGINKEFA
jgi:DNA repair protein RadD